MKITPIGSARIIMSNPFSKHNYFGWPSAARLQNGTIAVVASGFRLRHICPFGKTVISYSNDEGETYTLPAPVIDTVLDDRDGGIVPFGKSNVFVSSFNNMVRFQRQYADSYGSAYLDTVTTQEQDAYLGAIFRISHDYGITFGDLHKSPVTSPHGPLELPDGTLLWVGRIFSPEDRHVIGKDCVEAHKIYPDGTTEYVGRIDNIMDGDTPALSCEPHAILLEDGTLLVHIRVQHDNNLFTIFQSESTDNGKTWTTPRQLLSRLGGSPPHLMKHSSGLLICTYGYREAPYGVRAMFSKDNGKTWDMDHDIYINNVSGDLGYPSTIELKDGSLLTIFYAHPSENEPAVIMQQKWNFDA